MKLVGDGFKTKKGFLFLATVVESLAQDIAGANFFALGLSGVWTSTWGEINEDFLVYSYHICLRKFFEWKGFGVWKTIQGSIIYVLFLLFPGYLLVNIDEDEILVLPYTSSNNQLKLSHVIFVDLLILKLRDFAVHSYLKKEKKL